MGWMKIDTDRMEFFHYGDRRISDPPQDDHFYFADIEKVKDQEGVIALYVMIANIKKNKEDEEGKISKVYVGVPDDGVTNGGIIRSKLYNKNGHIMALGCPPFKDTPRGGNEFEH
ncbi:MAG: hypothetical protein AAF847_17740 [Bacteroidota bacterium]